LVDQVGLEIIEKIIQYISINDKSDFNNIIDKLKSLSDHQANDDHLNDFENTDSPSSCIVDVSEDESNEGEGDTLTHNKYPGQLCPVGSHRIQIVSVGSLL
jgi:hypothetical protein